ncbi:Ig-like domain-containing protein [Paenibacillus sp. RRE4]|uniref:Ig-like domain-containing protein n=1 Tax=Paenibacillus sp. RRE4 TaxID=2962587 RepID=UPI002882873E|nr:Ig-like domain-containing protein [Paenibacillus sp. RRE4]MDT0122629.1 Ig-like domain-containing protein [Paenibacillus sp. RRE4]
MKGKNKHNKLKPIMRKSMLAALGLGIALPVTGSLPQVQAGAIEPTINISRPVLNDDIYWLSHSSEQVDALPIMPSMPIGVDNNTVTIDLSTHFPSERFTQLGAISDNTNVARAYVTSENKLIVVPYRSGKINIQLQAKNALSPEGEMIRDNIELYISKKGDLNGDDKVDSADAVQLYNYLRNMVTRRGFSFVEMNQADVDRNGEPELADMNALLSGYANQSLGAKDNSYVLTFKQVDDAPYVLNGLLNGDLKVGATLTSNTDFFDPDGDTLRTMHYQWYRGSEASGEDKTEIIGATDAVYKITDAEQEKYLFLQITPESYSSDRPQGKPVVLRSESTVAVKQEDIVNLSPSNGSTEVKTNAPLVITYNRPVKINMSSYSSIIIRNLTSNQVEASYMVLMGNDFLIDENKIYINNPGLKYGANYSIEISNDAFKAADPDDNAYMQGTVVEQNGVPWTFTTRIPQ